MIENAILASGIGLAALSYVTSRLSSVPKALFKLFTRIRCHSIEVDSENAPELYQAIRLYLEEQGTAGNINHVQARLIDLYTRKAFNLEGYDGMSSKKLLFQPAPDFYIVKINNKKYVLEVERISKSQDNSVYSNSSLEKEKIYIYGFKSSRDELRNIFSEHILKIEDKFNNKVKIYSTTENRYSSNWDLIATKEKRDIDSIILDKKIKEDLISDIESFFKNKSWYTERYIPWKRGYLLYGPPGTGKSSTILALASKFNCSIFILNLKEIKGERQLVGALSAIPENSILVLEEVDSVVSNNREIDTDDVKKLEKTINLPILLNALDGIASSEGRLIFMTSNYPERIDPALIRPGRVDKQILLSNCTYQQYYEMFKRFYPKHEVEAKDFSNKAPAEGISPAKLQGFFIENKSLSAIECLAKVNELA